MNVSQHLSTSDLPTSLAEIDAAIFELESQRAEILRQHLDEAEARIAGLSPSASGSVALGERRVGAKKKKRAAKKKGAGKKGAGKKARAKKKGGRRSRVDVADRLARLTSIVKSAGKEGISAKKASEQTGIPYPAARAILSESGSFRREGEKRDSRFFLS